VVLQLGLDVRITPPHRNYKDVTKIPKDSRTWTDSLGKRPKRSLVPVAKELSKDKLDLVGAQEVRWEGDGTEPAGEYAFIYGKGNENHELGTVFFFFCLRESYQQLRG
jgi:hypothetical protein